MCVALCIAVCVAVCVAVGVAECVAVCIAVCVAVYETERKTRDWDQHFLVVVICNPRTPPPVPDVQVFCIPMSDVTRSHVRHDLFTRVTRLIHTCDKTHSHV